MLKFKPKYVLKPWGGDRIRDLLGRSDTPEGAVGESWELADLEEHQSIVAEGDRAGQTLGQLWRDGTLGGSAEGTFPFLLKWLDARESLSVQVHPDAQFCEATGLGEPKTEAWYVASIEGRAKLHLGNYPGLDPGILRQAIERGSIVKWMYEARPRVGEMYLVEAGTMHSVGAGLLLLEVQQPSTSTYRIFDWGRTGEDGEPRELHLDEACGAVRFNAFSLPQPKRQTVEGPGWALNTSMMGSVLPEEGLRVVIAEPGDCRIITDLGTYDMKRGDVLVAEKDDGALRVARGSCLWATESSQSETASS